MHSSLVEFASVFSPLTFEVENEKFASVHDDTMLHSAGSTQNAFGSKSFIFIWIDGLSKVPFSLQQPALAVF